MIAACTIARNEPFFLPLWCAYYARHADALFVLDHESDDGSTEGLPCEVVPVSNGGVCFDHGWLCATVAAFQAELLTRFDTVVYSDVDEFLCHPLGLRRFARSASVSRSRARGYHLVQHPSEDAYDASTSIMEQRQWWQRDPLYDKVLISREPLQWKVGFHFLREGGAAYADGLTLVHLHSFDREQARQRHAARMGWQWQEEERRLRHSEQWALEGQALEEWFDAQLEGAELVAGWLRAKEEF